MTENKSSVTNPSTTQTNLPPKETEYINIRAPKTSFYEKLKAKEGQNELFSRVEQLTKEGIKTLKQRQEEENEKQKQLQEEYKNDYDSISHLYEGVDPETIQGLKEKADQNNPFDENEKRLAGIITYSSKIIQQSLQNGQQQLNKKVSEKFAQRNEEEDLYDTYLWNNSNSVPIYTQSSKIPLYPNSRSAPPQQQQQQQKSHNPPSAPPEVRKRPKIDDVLDTLFD